MIYEYTQYNIVSLMQQVGTLNREQLLKFFSDEMDPSRIQYLLDKLVVHNYLKYNPVNNRYSYHAAPEVKEEIVRRRIAAFWVFANWGSLSLLQIDLLNYPLQFSAVDTDNMCYDVTVCDTESEAELARHYWISYAIKDIPDNVTHIAIVPEKEVGEAVRKYGFDCYGMLNGHDFSITYTSFDTPHG